VKSAPLTAAILTAVSIALLFASSYASAQIDFWLAPIDGGSPIISDLAGAVVQAVLTGYIGIVMAKVYSDVSFTAPRW
jgi:hypothetical protein